MHNTGTIYSSTERIPTVLPEMAELLPPLTGEQLAALETDILKNGCYSPVIVNEDMVVIDGHNRQRLCEQHGLPYQMAVFSFEDMLEAKQWALDTQKGRRNLDKWELGKIALRLKPDIEARARANQQEYHGNQYDSGLSATLPEVHSDPVDTRRELADTVGLGERTMGKVMQIDEHAPTAVKEALDSGDLSINQGYNITRQVRELPEEQREEAAALAVELEKAKKEIRQCDAEADRRGRIADLFCKAFEKAVLLTPTEENIRIWTECTRMTREEIEDSVKDDKGKVLDVILPVTELDRANAIFERILYTLPPEPERRPAKPLQRGHEVFRERQAPEREAPEQAPVRRQEQPKDKPRERQPPERKKPVLQPQEAPVRPPQPQREVSQRSEEQGRQQAPVTQRQVKEKNGSRSERDSHVIKISSSILKESGTTRGTSERPSIEARLQGYRGQGKKPSAPAKVKAKAKSQAKAR